MEPPLLPSSSTTGPVSGQWGPKDGADSIQWRDGSQLSLSGLQLGKTGSGELRRAWPLGGREMAGTGQGTCRLILTVTCYRSEDRKATALTTTSQQVPEPGLEPRSPGVSESWRAWRKPLCQGGSSCSRKGALSRPVQGYFPVGMWGGSQALLWPPLLPAPAVPLPMSER